MAVTRKSIILSAITLLASNSFAEKMLPGKWRSKFLLNFYDQDSNAGSQVFDDSGNEGVTVIEPMLFIAHQIDKTTNISGHFLLDTWTAESDTILDDKTGESGAGKVNQSRTAANINYSKEIEKNVLSTRAGYSSEYDYKSINGGISWEKPFVQDNFTLGLGFDIFKDSVNLFDYDNEVTAAATDKNVYSYNLSASQILTYTDIISFNLNLINQTGTLESIRNTTKIAGVRQAEVLPDKRNRTALTTQLVHGFSDTSSLSIKHRYYKDDWDLAANTYELSSRNFLQEDLGFLELSYRYHKQADNKYFYKTLSSAKDYFTSDSDQDNFEAHRFGVLYSFNNEDKKIYGFGFDKFEYTVAAYHYFRSNDLKYNIIQSSIGIEF